MLITINEMKKYIKLLRNIPYYPLTEKSTIFFEISVDKTVENGGFVRDVRQNNDGAAGTLKPGLILSAEKNDKGKYITQVSLAYAQVEYSPEFDMGTYLDLIADRGSVSKKDRDLLTALDAKLVKSEYIYAEFEI